MRVCIVGGTGNIDTSIVRLLLVMGHDVTCFNRGGRGAGRDAADAGDAASLGQSSSYGQKRTRTSAIRYAIRSSRHPCRSLPPSRWAPQPLALRGQRFRPCRRAPGPPRRRIVRRGATRAPVSPVCYSTVLTRNAPNASPPVGMRTGPLCLPSATGLSNGFFARCTVKDASLARMGDRSTATSSALPQL